MTRPSHRSSNHESEARRRQDTDLHPVPGPSRPRDRCRPALMWAVAGLLLGIGISPGAGGAGPAGQTAAAPDDELGAYGRTEASGFVARLAGALERGETNLQFQPDQGYLPSLLRTLDLSPASQVLVFSKTSPHRPLISPGNPRALFFNDRCALAYVPGADEIEIVSSDPRLGVVFHTLAQKSAARPVLTRDNRCLECHASAKTLNVPGLLVRSFPTSRDGEVHLLGGHPMVNHTTPFAERWGGYYVTGRFPAQGHLGNRFADGQAAIPTLAAERAGISDLKGVLDRTKYPEAGSDVVALLVLEHQAHMQNLLNRLQHDSEEAAREGASLRRAYPATEAVLKYMLFIGEAPLPAPVAGSSGFQRSFEALGRTDGRGRSLRQLDLQRRLLRFPCSYMIYSDAVATLPAPARKHLYRRLWEVLSGEDESPDYRSLPESDRLAVRDILRETKPDLPAYWRL